jgi:hypothetical protein
MQHLLNHMQCTSDQHCRGYLDILGLSADTQVDGNDHKISNVAVSFVGSQYRYVLGSFTGKYGKPLLLPDKVYGKGPNFIVESGIAEWRAPHGVALRLSQDLRIQQATLTLSGKTKAANQPISEDHQALREIAAAQAPVDALYRILADEMRRIMAESPGQPSPDVAKIMNSSAPLFDLGDPHVPLHVRIIEQGAAKWSRRSNWRNTR